MNEVIETKNKNLYEEEKHGKRITQISAILIFLVGSVWCYVINPSVIWGLLMVSFGVGMLLMLKKIPIILVGILIIFGHFLIGWGCIETPGATIGLAMTILSVGLLWYSSKRYLPETSIPSILLFILGFPASFSFFLIGILCFVTSYYLWHSKKWAGKLGIIVCIILIPVFFFFFSSSLFSSQLFHIASWSFLSLDVITIILIIKVWKSLQ